VKKLILLSLLTNWLLISFGQFPVQQPIGAKHTLNRAQGAYGSDSGYVMINSFPDTAAMNKGPYLKGIPGIMLRAGDTLWMRNSTATAWIKQTSSGISLTSWDINGNYGTNSSINFLGTVDNAALRFRVNNTPAGRITPLGSITYLDSLFPGGIYFGNYAGEKDTVATRNSIAIGSYSLRNYASGEPGSGQIAIGHMALYSYVGGITTGSNVAIGTRSQARNIAAYRNVSVGLNTLHNIRQGARNTAVGSLAFEWADSVYNNDAFGESSLRSLTIGVGNVAIGNNSMFYTSGGVYSVTMTGSSSNWTTATVTFSAPNVAPFGFTTAVQATGTAVISGGQIIGVDITEMGRGYTYATVTFSGDGTSATATVLIGEPGYNTALGIGAMFHNRMGYGNTAIGAAAGGGLISADPFISTVDSFMTFVGYGASRNLTNPNGVRLSKSTAIGYNAKVGQSNSLILGGTGSDQPKVGIGNIAPQDKFHVTGRVRFDSALVFLGTTTQNSGYVGPFGSAFLAMPNLDANGFLPAFYMKNASAGSNAAIALQMNNNLNSYLILEMEGSNRTSFNPDGVLLATNGAGGIKMIPGTIFKIGFGSGTTNDTRIYKDSLFTSLRAASSPTDSQYVVTYNATTKEHTYYVRSSGGGGSSYVFSSPLSEVSNTVSIADAGADGSTKGAAAFIANDFNASSGVISIDYVNGQAASGSLNGFVTTGTQSFAGDKTGTGNWTFSNFPTISAGTDRRIPFFTTSGLLIDDANLIFNSSGELLLGMSDVGGFMAQIGGPVYINTTGVVTSFQMNNASNQYAEVRFSQAGVPRYSFGQGGSSSSAPYLNNAYHQLLTGTNNFVWINPANTVIATLTSSGLLGINNSSPSSMIHIGTAGSTTGTISVDGATSGSITIRPQAAAGTWTFTLPVNDGTSGQVLSTDGSGITSWVDASSGGGTVTSLSFTDGSGFDGTVTNSTSTPTLALTTTLTTTHVPIIGASGALTGSADLAYTSGLLNIGSGDVTGLPTPSRLFSIQDVASSSGHVLNAAFKSTQTVASTGSLQGVEGYVETANATGNVGFSIATIGNAEHSGAGTISSLRGVQAGTIISGSGNVDGATSLFVAGPNISGSSTVALAQGIYISASTAGGSGTITDYYGIYHTAPGGGTFSNRKIGLYLEDMGDNDSTYQIYSTGGKVRFDDLFPTSSTDTTNYKPLGIDANGILRPMGNWFGGSAGNAVFQNGGTLDTLLVPSITGDTLIIKSIRVVAGANITVNPTITGDEISYEIVGTGGGSGTVTSFTFTDGNGFDGTVTNSTTTPTLSLTTTVTNNQILYSNSGAIAGESGIVRSGAGLFSVLNGIGVGGSAVTTYGVNITAGTGAGINISGTAYTAAGFINTATVSPAAGATVAILNNSGTIVEAGSGTHTLLAGTILTAPVITGGTATVTNTATLSISGSPSATVTGNNYAIMSSGPMRLALLGTAMADTINNKPLGIDSDGDIIPMVYWPVAQYVLYEEFFGGATGSVLVSLASGGNTTTVTAIPGTDWQGLVTLSSAASASGRAGVGMLGSATVCNQMTFNSGTNYYFATKVRIEDLSTAGERFRVRCGFGNRTDDQAHTDGAYFNYRDDESSGQWVATTIANSTSTGTVTASGVTVAADTDYILEIIGTTAELRYYINGTLVATHTSNIPSGTSRTFGIFNQMIKTVGTTARLVYLDWVKYSSK
jgi:hypothetical protein